MAYGDFTLESAATSFGLTIGDAPDLFADVQEVVPSDWLKTTLGVAHLGTAR